MSETLPMYMNENQTSSIPRHTHEHFLQPFLDATGMTHAFLGTRVATTRNAVVSWRPDRCPLPARVSSLLPYVGGVESATPAEHGQGLAARLERPFFRKSTLVASYRVRQAA